MAGEQEAMIRWQGYSREQRSTVNSLFLTYAAALLGLATSFVFRNDVVVVPHPRFFLGASFAALASLVIGCVVVLMRLREARLTARRARFVVEGMSPTEVEQLESKVEWYGGLVNRLLPTQIIVFAIAAVCFLAWVASVFSAKMQLAT